jgi:hypothetical protein
MDEIKFVARCLGFAALVLVLSQLKTGGVTIEDRVQATLVNSQVADFVNKAAQGGVKLIQATASSARTYFEKQKKTSSEKEVVVVEDEISEE